ncbi:MAG: hypothetical protein WCT26_01850 [Candidatus Buchananbacteria bacterium]
MDIASDVGLDLLKVLGEMFLIVFCVLFFVCFVGIRVQCQVCGEMFSHKTKNCPNCGHEYGQPPPEDADEGELTEDEDRFIFVEEYLDEEDTSEK